MKTKAKLLITVLVGVLSILAFVVPRWYSPSKFHVTNHPQIALEDAKKSGKPIFLEFYAKW